MSAKILITGATGAIGSQMVDLLLKRTDADLYLLTHQQDYDNADSKYQDRIHLIRGDITHSRLDIKRDIYLNLSKNITHILHAAAITKFNLPLEEVRKVNVTGTKHVLDFAKHCRSLKQFGFLSTVYVAGKRSGKIYENELIHSEGFVNTYEQSKYEAELLIKKEGNKMPISVYRLSTVLGNSKTGKVTHFTAPHQALRMMYLGLASMIPGTEDFVVNLIPADFSSNIIFELFINNFKPFKTYHIAANSKKSYELKELVDESYKFIAQLDKQWKNKGFPKPSIVTNETFDLFIKSAVEAENHLIFTALSALRYFAPQLGFPKEFDNSTLVQVIPNYYSKLPDVRSYYRKVVKYCYDTKWGKNEHN